MVPAYFNAQKSYIAHVRSEKMRQYLLWLFIMFSDILWFAAFVFSLYFLLDDSDTPKERFTGLLLVLTTAFALCLGVYFAFTT
jgi:hypothetical protein